MQPYKLCRLVKESDAVWYIEYYQTEPTTGERKRLRKTYQMNRKKDLDERSLYAHQKITEINSKLEYGYPYNDKPISRKAINCIEALEIAYEQIISDLRHASIVSIRSIFKRFIKWVKKNGFRHYAINGLNKVVMKEWVSHIESQGFKNVTVNNYVNRVKSFFIWLLKEEYILENPLAFYSQKREAKKIRRAISPDEQLIIYKYALRNDRLLALAIAFLYYCGLRPREQKRLKRFNINTHRGTIDLNGNQTKNKDDDVITINAGAKDFIYEMINNLERDEFIFGEHWKLGSDKSCGKNAFNQRHRYALNKLLKDSKLNNMDGISFYSWKDSGALALDGKASINSIMRHYRHKSLDYTQRYMESVKVVNEDIQKADISIGH